MKKIGFLSLLFIAVLPNRLPAQCCSPGSPTGGTTNQGTLEKGAWRLVAFGQHSISKHYFEGSKRIESDYFKKAVFNFAGVSLSRGWTDRFTTDLEMGWFFNRTIRYYFDPPLDVHKGSGLADFTLIAKYGLYKSLARQLEVAAGVGVSIPSHLRLLNDKDGLELPRDVQPSLNAPAYVATLFLYKGMIQRKLHFFWVNRLTVPTPDREKYLYGKTWSSSLFVSRILNLNWSIIAQFRNEYRTIDHFNTVRIVSTGGETVYFSPQVNYQIAQKWNLSLIGDLPVWRDLNGSQLGKTWGLTVVANRIFKPKTKAKGAVH